MTCWLLNPMALRAAKTGLTFFVNIFLTKAFLLRIFEGEMFIRILPTTLLQIFCENLLYIQVIFKSLRIADDTFLGNSECEWVKSGKERVNANMLHGKLVEKTQQSVSRMFILVAECNRGLVLCNRHLMPTGN